MSTQHTPEQLQKLAAEFDATPEDGYFDEGHPIFQMAADVDRLNAENRRLQQQRDELLDALESLVGVAEVVIPEGYTMRKAREAIAKHRGQV